MHLLDTWVTNTIIISPSLYNNDVLRQGLQIELKKAQKILRKRMFQVPVYVCIFIVFDSINQIVPWFFPVTSLFTLRSLFSLPSKYRKEIKKIQCLTSQLDVLDLHIRVLPELQYVERYIQENDFRRAIKIVDDLDWIINQEKFSDEMLLLAEYIQILDKNLQTNNTIKNRSTQLLSYKFYRDIFYFLKLTYIIRNIFLWKSTRAACSMIILVSVVKSI